MQRLRRIHQTALAVFTYPSATHTRFEHSLGCTIIADKMIRALIEKTPLTPIITGVQRAEVRLACLLHDCGHGPFSHASELVYDSNDPRLELENLRNANKNLLGEAAGHEILSYLVVNSGAFQTLWEGVAELYDPRRDRLLCDPKQINPKRVAKMILGLRANETYPEYLSKLVNGPFDADKFDYIIRDGYFSGLVTAVDIERLFISLDIDKAPGMSAEEVLCMDLGGASVLEQVLFNKMLLFASFYQHHKNRATFRKLARILSVLREKKCPIRGAKLVSAADFLKIDDYDILTYSSRRIPELQRNVEEIRARALPMRALVISKDAILDDDSLAQYVWLMHSKADQRALEESIGSKAGLLREVYVDFPEEPNFARTAEHSMVRLRRGQLVPLDQVYPASGWVSGYSEYRYRAYVFCPLGRQEQVAEIALQEFENRGMRLDRELCKTLAKWEESSARI